MACPNNDCLDNNCADCNNPCYEDCGCLNPTTFECITKPGVHSAIGVTDDMNGKEVLDAINNAINSLEIPSPVPGSDVYTKVSGSDTTSGYLNNKISNGQFLTKNIINPSGNELIRLDANLAAMISTDGGNILEIGTDNKLRVITPTADVDVAIVEGAGVSVTGTGVSADPWVISINPSITALRTCFDGSWRNITLVAPSDPNVVYVSGNPQYRIRFDGTIEFKGSLTYTVTFGTYSTSARKRTVTIASIPTTCVTVGEQAGVSDLKSINYIDQPGVGDQITQMYGYIIRKSTQNIILEFQSAYIAGATKTIVVNFEGAVSYPTV